MGSRLAPALLMLSFTCGCGAADVAPGGSEGGASPLSAPTTTAGSESLPLPERPSDPREPVLAATLTRVLTERHLQRPALDDELSRRAFSNYLRSIDRDKLLLLGAHVSALRAHADQMDDQMRSGDLALSRQGAGLLAERQAIVARAVAELLREPFDFERAEHAETDADKRAFCETEAELRDRWRRLLKLEVLQRFSDEQALGAGASAPFEAREKSIRAALANTLAARFARLQNPSSIEPAERFFDAIATAHDPHTRYLAPAAQAELDIALTGSLQGIGATLGEQGQHVVIVDLLIGGAGWSHGELEVGDVLLAVAQAGQPRVLVDDVPLPRVAAMLRGPSGSEVTLRVRKPDGHVKEIAITRAAIDVEAAFARAAELHPSSGLPSVGYVYLPSFYDKGGQLAADRTRNATADVRRYLQTFEKRKLGGVILDLRGNQGGLLDHAQHIAGLLIHKGPVVQTRSADGTVKTRSDIHPFATFNGRVVVLVDRFSASASEVLAAALQDHRRALVVGTGPTYGKGTVQELVDLDRLRFGAASSQGQRLGLLVMTYQQNYRVDGRSTQSRGVLPDVVLPDPAAHLPAGDRMLPNALPFGAIAPLTIEPHERTWNPKALASKSAARRASHEMFARVEARAEVLRRHQRATRAPLRREEWMAQRAAQKNELSAVQIDLGRGAARFEVRPVKDTQTASASASGRRQRQWRELARDPWVEESMLLLNDMRH